MVDLKFGVLVVLLEKKKKEVRGIVFLKIIFLIGKWDNVFCVYYFNVFCVEFLIYFFLDGIYLFLCIKNVL